MSGRVVILRRELRLLGEPPDREIPADWRDCGFHGCPQPARFLRIEARRFPSGARSTRSDPFCVRHGLDWAARHGVEPGLPPAQHPGGRRRVAEDPVNAYVGQAMRRRRELLGLRQADVARAIAVSQQAVQAYEAGRAVPSPAGLYRLAQVLRCGVAELFPRAAAEREAS